MVTVLRRQRAWGGREGGREGEREERERGGGGGRRGGGEGGREGGREREREPTRRAWQSLCPPGVRACVGARALRRRYLCHRRGRGTPREGLRGRLVLLCSMQSENQKNELQSLAILVIEEANRGMQIRKSNQELSVIFFISLECTSNFNCSELQVPKFF